MTPQELQEIAHSLFGYGWRAKLSRSLDVSYSAVKRWATGDTRVPTTVAATLELLLITPRELRPQRWR